MNSRHTINNVRVLFWQHSCADRAMIESCEGASVRFWSSKKTTHRAFLKAIVSLKYCCSTSALRGCQSACQWTSWNWTWTWFIIVDVFFLFLGACYATLQPALSVRHTLLFVFCGLWPHCSCPNDQVTSNTAPAHPHATGVAVYLALFNL